MADARGQGHNVPKFSSFKGKRDGRDERGGRAEHSGRYGRGDDHGRDGHLHGRDDRYGRGDRSVRNYRGERDHEDERDYNINKRDHHGGRDNNNAKRTRNPNRLGHPPSSWKGKRILEQCRREEERIARTSRRKLRDDDPFPGRSDLSRIKDSDLFIIDYKGDKNNLSYGEIDPYSVPIYCRPQNSLLVGKRTAVKVQQVASFSMDDLLETKPGQDREASGFETTGEENVFGEESPDFMEIEDPAEKAAEEARLTPMITPKG